MARCVLGRLFGGSAYAERYGLLSLCPKLLLVTGNILYSLPLFHLIYTFHHHQN